MAKLALVPRPCHLLPAAESARLINHNSLVDRTRPAATSSVLSARAETRKNKPPSIAIGEPLTS
jgi:hypothetical protein